MSYPRAVVEFRVRWPDCDPAGIVHFANFFTYFELGCMDYIRHRGLDWAALYAQFGFKGFPRVEAHARYRAMARHDDRLASHAWVSEVTRKVVTFHCEVHRPSDGTLIAEGHLKAAFVGPNGRAMEVPPALAAWLRGGPPPPGAVLTGDDVCVYAPPGDGADTPLPPTRGDGAGRFAPTTRVDGR